jgi:hypothetical protein
MKTTFTKVTIEMEVQKIDDDDDDDQFEYTIRLENGTVVENVPPPRMLFLLLFVVCCLLFVATRYTRSRTIHFVPG